MNLTAMFTAAAGTAMNPKDSISANPVLEDTEPADIGHHEDDDTSAAGEEDPGAALDGGTVQQKSGCP